MSEHHQNVRKRVLSTRNGKSPRCHWCKTVLTDQFTIDHIVPKSKGGRLTPDNMVISCRACNQERGNMSYNDYREIVLRRRASP